MAVSPGRSGPLATWDARAPTASKQVEATTSRTTATSHQLGTAHAESRHVHPPMVTQCGEGIAQLPSDVKHEQPHIHQTVALRTQTVSYRRELWAQGHQVAHARPVSLGASGPTTATTAATTAARAGGNPRGPLGDDGTLHVPARRSTPRQARSAPQRPQHTPQACTPQRMLQYRVSSFAV